MITDQPKESIDYYNHAFKSSHASGERVPSDAKGSIASMGKFAPLPRFIPFLKLNVEQNLMSLKNFDILRLIFKNFHKKKIDFGNLRERTNRQTNKQTG